MSEGQTPEPEATPKSKPKLVMGPDGAMRSQDLEDELNKLFASAFRGRAGGKVLDHLKTITLGQVAGPEIETGPLYHMEGRRFLYYVIDQRIQRGKHGTRRRK